MPAMTIDQALRLAVQHHQAGRLPEAEALYRQILAVAPNHPDAQRLLGLLAAQTGHREDGIAWLRRAIAAAPDRAAYHGDLGNMLAAMGRIDEAIESFRRMLALEPNQAEGHYNLGLALHSRGQWQDAIDSFRRALQIKPGFVDALYNLGTLCNATGQFDQALIWFRQALKLKPDHAQAHSNLGIALKALGQADEAIACFHRAIQLRPDYAEAHNNLGSVYTVRKQFDQAIDCYRRALELRGDYIEAHNNLGNALKEIGRLDEAVACYQQALAIRPDDVAVHSNLLFTLPYHPASDAQSLFEAACRWNQQHASPLKTHIRPHANDRQPERRLRVGYVSPDLWNHPVGRFMLPLLSAHDRERFEIFCYALSPISDQVTGKLRSHASAWRSLVGVYDEAAAETIRKDGIDILVDLAMHTAGNRILIFAQKPAPVQVTYLACAGGTGVDAIDYRLTDRFLDPDESQDRFYLEKSFRLSGTYWCYQQSEQTPAVNPPPALASGCVTFGCLNNFCKVNPSVLEVWAELLKKVADSRLLLYCPQGAHREPLRQFFADRGVGGQRLELIDWRLGGDYLKAYDRLDIALDPFPYSGGTTTCDALWMGVPVVTLAGRTAVGRSGVSILTTLGHPEWIAQTTSAYVSVAAALAANVSRLSELRNGLRGQMQASRLMDAQAFARDIEAAYRTMWRRRCAAP